MAEEAKSSKWEGKTKAEIKGLKVEQVWPLLEDFCSFNKLVPQIEICDQIEGVYGQPGLIRHCGLRDPSRSTGADDSQMMWANEKLLVMDPIQRCFSYAVVDGNTGLKSYVATIKVFEMNGDDGKGCVIEWSFVCEPADGWTFDGLLSLIDSLLKTTAKNIEELCSA
ncbi:Polyketide cyclase/dehydrase [Dillenia turbinata]|uniref:Polyketide cyclase/dehydrase n=1 Tax=Dillenia turbinata TaxID=194707 RepID=A0AAN8U997_9MAGN